MAVAATTLDGGRLGRRGRPADAALLPPARAQPRDDRPRPVHAAVAAPRAVRRSGAFPLDGIVFPKVEHPEEVELVHDLLARAEAALGLPVGSIRVGLLIESGWAAAQLGAIASVAAPRLCAPDLRRRRLQRRPRAALHPQRPPPRGLGAGRDRRGRRRDRRAGHRRHDPRLPGRRPGARRRGEPDALARPDAAGLRRRGPRARARDARQVGRPPRPAVRRPARLRGGLHRTRPSSTRRPSWRRTAPQSRRTRARR